MSFRFEKINKLLSNIITTVMHGWIMMMDVPIVMKYSVFPVAKYTHEMRDWKKNFINRATVSAKHPGVIGSHLPACGYYFIFMVHNL